MLVWFALLGGWAVTATKPNVLFIVADDLGWNDLSIHNGNVTSTPRIDSLIKDGIWLNSYYTYTICSPSRASINTGRYHWELGWYDMSLDDNKCASQNFTLLPQLMKQAGYATAATGKWDIGYAHEKCVATDSGHDEFLGYYKAAMADYWFHGDRQTSLVCTNQYKLPVHSNDMSMGKGRVIGPSNGPGINGTYNSDVFTQFATEFISSTPISDPIFLYYAPMNVHAAAPFNPNEALALQSPCSIIDNDFDTIEEDWQKTMAGMLKKLDDGVGEVVDELKKSGRWENTIVAFVSDNGGPLPHSMNHPLRGGKHTFWEGGLRVSSFLSGPVIKQRGGHPGTSYNGILHASDWYKIIAEGVAGVKIPSDTGPVPPSGFNALDAILANTTSPRTEVISQVNNTYFDMGVQVIRVGDYKLIRGKAGDARIVGWPQRGKKTLFGHSGGVRDSNDRCRAPKSKAPTKPQKCDPYCLFDVVKDLSESHDLASHPNQAARIASMINKLDAAGRTGPSEYAYTLYPTKAAFHSAYRGVCENAVRTNFTEPLDWKPTSTL